MRIIAPILLAICLLPAPTLACGHGHHHHDHNVHISNHTSFEIEGDILIISHDSRRAEDEVRVTKDGGLRVNDVRIKTDRKDRKLLSEFFEEAADLNERAEAIAEDAEEIAAVSEAFAAHTVFAVLKSLGDNDHDEAEFTDMESDFEEKIKKIEKIGEEIEEQADKVMDIAEDLRQRIPALAELDWFLDD